MTIIVQNSLYLLGGVWAMVILLTLCRQDTLASCALAVFGATVTLSSVGYLGMSMAGVIPPWHRVVYLVSFPIACFLVAWLWPCFFRRKDPLI
jgi:hypothetical protein